MNDNKVKVPYTYDTPTGIIEKEGKLFRGMSTYDKNRPLHIRILAIFFGLILFIPGAMMTYITTNGLIQLFNGELQVTDETIGFIIPAIFGILLFGGGITTIYQNLRK